jgi:hypothetical protein
MLASDVINNINNNKKCNGNTVTSLVVRHVFQLEYANISHTNSALPSFGDFLRGSYALWQICNCLNVKMELYFHDHPIKHCLTQINNNINLDPKQVHYYGNDNNNSNFNVITNLVINNLNRDILNIANLNTNVLNIATNIFPNNVKMCNEFKVFIKKYLQPSPQLQQVYLSTVGNINNYIVIHIRGGDPVGTNNVTPSLIFKIRTILEQKVVKFVTGKTVFVISDNLTLRNTISQMYKYKTVPTTKICHLGNSAYSDLDHLNGTMIDFFLMSQASTVYSLSVYRWNSGFSEWCTKIFDVPLVQHIIT